MNVNICNKSKYSRSHQTKSGSIIGKRKRGADRNQEKPCRDTGVPKGLTEFG